MASLEVDAPPLQAINHSYGDKQRSLATLFPEEEEETRNSSRRGVTDQQSH